MPDEISDVAACSVMQASQRTGVGIAAVSATYNMIHPAQQVRDAGLRRLNVILSAAKAMGTNLVTLCTGTRDAEDQWRHHPGNDLPDAWKDLTAEMAKALELAERHDVNLGVEPELANVVNSAMQAKRLIADMQSQKLRIILDPANLFEVATNDARRSTISSAIDMLGPYIAMAHAKDRDATGAFVAAGTGVIDFEHFIAGLKAVNFYGPVVTHGLQEAEAPQVAAFLRGMIAT